ncbi:MAG: DNA polymerase III subunit gamma/tau [Clostridia bacterium]|nr:DNA polymerase III subunit gamma/tau [Clostridia bacterium]
MYQALYRKWRPRTFSDVSGQETVTAALKNELKTGRLSHAYLFTGCRGTGKTTCAKILAKAVNCAHPVDGDPCNECAICRGIDDGTILDVTEIDAASNNGVDSIRDLRDEVAFTPVSGTYRVYIIDEVHMLSAGAFNALLKTLEEPPAHVIFILATTEVHKLPATILSRCQRFDFGRIRPEEIAARITYVATEEGLTVTPDAAMLLARLADGALRDGLSLLDQCASVAQHIDMDTVTAVTGMAGQDTLAQLTDCVAAQDAPAALALVDTLYRSAKDMERLCAEWVTYLRNLMVLNSVTDVGELVVATPDELGAMRAQAQKLGLATILHMMEVLQGTLDRLKGGVSRRVEMEMAVLRLCDPRLDDTKAALIHRIETLENAIKNGVVAPSTIPPVACGDIPPLHKGGTPTASATNPIPTAAESEAIPTPMEAPLAETPNGMPVIPAPTAVGIEPIEKTFDRWAEVLDHLRQSCPPLFGMLDGTTALLKEGSLVICIENPLLAQLLKEGGNKEQLQNAIRQVTGQTYPMALRRKQQIKKPENDPLAQLLTAGRGMGIEVNEKE